MSILVPNFPQIIPPTIPISCTNVIIDAFSPSSYTPANAYLCGHLSGIDTKFAQINASLTSINAVNVTVNSFTPAFYDPATTALSSNLMAIDDALGFMDTFAPQTFNKQLFTDGDNGTFTSNITGITSGGSLTLSQDNTIFHELSGSSLKAISTLTGTRTITHTTGINFKANKQYEFSVYVFAPVIGGAIASNISISTTGTGSIRQINTPDMTAGRWVKVSTRYFPDADQVANIVITISGFTIATSLNFGNLVTAVNPSILGSQLSNNYFSTISDVTDGFNRIADNFVSEGGTITTSALNLNLTVDKSVYWQDGKVFYRNLIGLGGVLIANNDNYLFYDTFNDSYIIKSVVIANPQPPTNDGEQILWKITTDFVGTAATVDKRSTSPFSSMFIADGSITTIKLANTAVTDAKMSTTGVIAGTYLFADVVVNAQGRITSATSPVTLTSPIKNNLLQYDAGLGKWVNTSNLTLEANSATLPNNGTLESPQVRLVGYYDSNAGAPIVATPYTATIQHLVTATTPVSRMAFSIAGEWMSLTNLGLLGINTTTPAAKIDISNTIGITPLKVGTAFYVTDLANTGIGTSTFDASAVRNLGVFNGTAPAASVADMFNVWAQDIEGVATKSGMHLRTEDGSIHAFGDYHYFGDPSTNGSWRIGVSGTTFIFQIRTLGVWTTHDTIL